MSIAEIVGEYVNLRKQGASLTGLCPFHAERSPSFSVSEKKGAFYCFGCQKGGDVFDFLQEMQGVSFPEAVRILAGRAGKALPPQFQGRGGRGAVAAGPNQNAEQELLYKLNRFVAQFYHERLLSPAGEEARAYLKGRGITDETIKSAYLGWAPDDWAQLTEFLDSKKAPLEKAALMGLIRKKDKDVGGRAHYDVFRGRVIFPIVDRRGRVAGFGGRLLVKADGPKYLNSSESPIFAKSEQFYGIFTAQKHIRELDRCIIVEGYMDCLALQQAGISTALATLGTALTETHVRRLQRLTQNVTLLYDGDAAGQAAQLRAMELFLDHGVVARGLALPEGLDPDEFIMEKGAGELSRLLDGAPHLLDRQILEAKGQAGPAPEERARALQKILPWVARLTSETARLVRLQDLAQHFALPLSALEKQVMQIRGSLKPAVAGPRPPLSAAPRPSSGAQTRSKDRTEQRFLELLVMDAPAALASPEAENLALELQDPLLREAAQVVISAVKSGKTVDVSMLDDVMSPESRRHLSRALASGGEGSRLQTDPQRKAEWEDLMKHLHRRRAEKDTDRLRQEIQKAETLGQHEELARLMGEFNRLQKELKEFG